MKGLWIVRFKDYFGLDHIWGAWAQTPEDALAAVSMAFEYQMVNPVIEGPYTKGLFDYLEKVGESLEGIA